MADTATKKRVTFDPKTALPARLKSSQTPSVDCDHCGLLGLCELAGLDRNDTAMLERLVYRRRRVPKGMQLFESDSVANYVYAVKAGAFKTVSRLADGRERIVAYSLPGELIGLEGLDWQPRKLSVIAAENSAVCVLDLSRVYLLGERAGDLHLRLVTAMSRHLRHTQWPAMLMSSASAEQRVAGFLVSTSSRLAGRGLPHLAYRLPMFREEIGNHLGLAVETVVRMFKQLQGKQLIQVSGRQVEIQNWDGLCAIAAIPTQS